MGWGGGVEGVGEAAARESGGGWQGFVLLCVAFSVSGPFFWSSDVCFACFDVVLLFFGARHFTRAVASAENRAFHFVRVASALAFRVGHVFFVFVTCICFSRPRFSVDFRLFSGISMSGSSCFGSTSSVTWPSLPARLFQPHPEGVPGAAHRR